MQEILRRSTDGQRAGRPTTGFPGPEPGQQRFAAVYKGLGLGHFSFVLGGSSRVLRGEWKGDLEEGLEIEDGDFFIGF
jgi:hypothetical protein